MRKQQWWNNTYKEHERQRMYKRNIETRSRNHCCFVKGISITYSKCFLFHIPALAIQHGNAHAPYYITLPHFPTLSHKRHDFRENVIEHKTRVSIFSTTFA